MKRIVFVLLLSGCFTLIAQGTPDASPSDIQLLVNSQFGEQFVLLQGFPVLTGDFNGDGVEDAVFVVTSHGAIQSDGRFHMIDPSSDYFGIGDARLTSQFFSKYPSGPRYMLIVHGNGKEGWRAKEPKDRFVVINMTFDHLSIGHVVKKKKTFDDIGIEETGILNSFLYWNGRGYKWQPGAAEL